ncbi:MAG: hypothetical protein Q8L54_10100 [Devosia sp.]|nr:hypothetical protein [Devosia sp.]
MVFAEAVKVQPHLIGEFDLFEQILQALRRRLQRAAQRVGCIFGKGVKADLHDCHPSRQVLDVNVTAQSQESTAV